MAHKKDALDDLGFLDELDGWKLADLTNTIAHMLRSALDVAICLSRTATQPELDDKRIQNLSLSMNNIARALEKYMGIYSWVTAQHQGRTNNQSALQELLPLLTPPEMRQLQTWLQRLDMGLPV